MPIKIAAIQFDVRIADGPANLDKVEAGTIAAAQHGAKLMLFPEAAITGYCYRDLNEALSFAEVAPLDSITRMTRLCHRLDVFVIYGTLERQGDQVFNLALLVGPDGLVGRYEKVHLPYLGVDRFSTAGDQAPQVYDAAGLRVGMIICYDLAFPEITRSLALDGADLVAQMTNSPGSADFARQVAVPARAWENGIYFARANRIGCERGVAFPGQSQICDPFGATVAQAAGDEPQIIYAEIDPQLARNKRRVITPGKFETDIFQDRRPDVYARLVQQDQSPDPA